MMRMFPLHIQTGKEGCHDGRLVFSLKHTVMKNEVCVCVFIKCRSTILHNPSSLLPH